MDIRKNDTVKVITGRGRNMKDGRRVLAVFPNDGKLLVEGVKVVKKHIKSQGQRTKGGIADQESRIAISNVMVICPSCQQPARIGHDHKGERSIRICKRCDSPLDK